MVIRVLDPQHFNTDPDPAFQFYADPDQDPAPCQGDANLCDHCSTDPSGLYFEPPLRASMAPI